MKQHEQMEPDLSGKVALVTDMGSALGFQLARALVQAGAHVHAVHPDHAECLRQIEQLRAFGAATGHVVDLQDGMALMQFARLVVEEVAQLHILVSNVRVARAQDSTALFDQAVLEKYDLLGDLCLVQELVPALRDGSTVTDPARVILVGEFQRLRPPVSPPARKAAGAVSRSYAEGIAQRFMERRINLNFIDLASPPAGGTEEAGASIVQSLLSFTSAEAARVRGEVGPALQGTAARGAA